MSTVAGPTWRYDGFLSYSTTADYQTARRMEAFLEAIHKLASRDTPVRHLQICRDGSDFRLPNAARERPPDDDPIWDIIHSQLAESRCLLVLCSPASVASPWVSREVDWFLANRGADAVMPVVTAGADPIGRPEECFPPPLVAAGLHRTRIWYDLRGYGSRSKDGQRGDRVRDPEDELVRVASDLLDWDADAHGQLTTLWQREQLRTRRRQASVAGVAALILIALAIYATYQARQASRAAARAQVASFVNVAAAQRDAATGVLVLNEAGRLSEAPPYGATSLAVRFATTPRPLAILRGHESAVVTVAFAPRSDTLLTASQDGTARVWPAGSAAAVVLRGSGAPLTAAVFSPDAALVATAAIDGNIAISPADGKGSSRRLSGHTGAVRSLQISDDGQLIVSASDDGTAWVWRVADGSTVGVLSGHEGAVQSAVFSKRGDRVLTASDDGTTRVWDVSNGRELSKFGYPGYIRFSSAQFGPDERMVIASSSEGTGWIFDIAQRFPFMTLPGSSAPIVSAAFSGNGEWIVGAQEESVRLWRVAALRWVGQRNESASTFDTGSHIRKAVFSADSTRVAGVSDDGVARVWTIDESEEPLVLGAHDGPILDVAFSADGTRLATASGDGTVRVWRVAAPAEPTKADLHRGPVAGVQLSAAGDHIATRTRDGVVRVWTRQGERVDAARELNGSYRTAELSSDGSHIVTVNDEGELTVLRFDTLQETSRLPQRDGARLAAIDDGGMHVVTLAGERNVRVWRTGMALPIELKTGDAFVVRVAMSADGRYAAAAGQDGVVQLWRVGESGDGVELRGHQMAVTTLAFSSDGRYLASGSDDGTARVWDVSGVAPPRVFAHTSPVYSVAFAAGGDALVTGSLGAARVWRLHAADVPIDLPMSGGETWSVAFSPDAAEALAADRDGRLWSWHIGWRWLAAHLSGMRACLPADARVRLLGEIASAAAAAASACAAR
jgi:WD40 repeat protein